MNQYSIWIEIIWPLADGGFTDKQRETVAKLTLELCTIHKIPKENVLRHKDIAPGRKVDVADSFGIKTKNVRRIQIIYFSNNPTNARTKIKIHRRNESNLERSWSRTIIQHTRRRPAFDWKRNPRTDWNCVRKIFAKIKEIIYFFWLLYYGKYYSAFRRWCDHAFDRTIQKVRTIAKNYACYPGNSCRVGFHLLSTIYRRRNKSPNRGVCDFGFQFRRFLLWIRFESYETKTRIIKKRLPVWKSFCHVGRNLVAL